MTREQKQIVVIVAGLALMAVLFTHQWIAMKKKKAKGRTQAGTTVQSSPGAVVPVPGVVSSPADSNSRAAAVKFDLPPLSAESAREQKMFNQKPWGRNPFALPASGDSIQKGENQPQPLSMLVISAVVMRDGTGMAVVNDEIVRPGDVLQGYKVVTITTKGIVLDKDGETVEIPYGK